MIGDITSVDDIEELSNSLTGKIHDLNDNLSLAEFSTLVKDKRYLIIPLQEVQKKSYSTSIQSEES